MGFRQMLRDLYRGSQSESDHQDESSITPDRFRQLVEENHTLKRMLAQHLETNDRKEGTLPLWNHDTPNMHHNLRHVQSSARLNQGPLRNKLRQKQSMPSISDPAFISHYNQRGTHEIKSLYLGSNIQGQQQQRQQANLGKTAAAHRSKENVHPQEKLEKKFQGINIHKDSVSESIDAQIPEPSATSTVRNTWKRKMELRFHNSAEEEDSYVLTNRHDFNKGTSGSEFGARDSMLNQQRPESRNHQFLAQLRDATDTSIL